MKKEEPFDHLLIAYLASLRRRVRQGLVSWHLWMADVLHYSNEDVGIAALRGYVVIQTGNGDEDAFLIKMVLDHSTGVSARSIVRKRQHSTATRHFIRFLGTDEILRDYAKRNTGQWKELRGLIVEMLWAVCH